MSPGAEGAGSPITVTGLPPGRYTFTVEASNGAGAGAPSSASPAVPITGTGTGTGGNPPPQASITVDFRSTEYPVDKWSVGSTISTYGAYLNTNTTWRNTLAALGPLSWRIPLRWNGGNPGSSAGGGQSSGDAATYIRNIRAIGGTPYVIIGGDGSDNGESTDDVNRFVHYFNDNNGSVAGGRLERLIIGNEPENSGDGGPYINALPSMIAAAKNADAGILVAAPAAASYDTTLLQQAAAVSTLDILSYHTYDGDDSLGLGFPTTSQYHQHIVDMRAMGPGMAAYGVEEFNWHWQYAGMTQFYDWHNLCFVASVIGQTISAGGHANQYSDAGGCQGIIADGNEGGPPFLTTNAAYWGIGMWTGMNGRFRRFGTATVPTTSTVADVDAFATSNGKVMLINKDTVDHTVSVGLGGRTAGSYTIWQTVQDRPTAPPTRVAHGTGYSGSLLQLTLPAGTVSSVEID